MTTAQLLDNSLFDASISRKEVAEPAVAWGASQESYRSLEEEFTDLVETYSSMAYNIAFRMLHNSADAEDAVQEAFISAYKALPKFKGQSKVTTWLYRIVVNACLMKIRRETSRSKYLVQTEFDETFIPDQRNDPAKAAINGELGEVLERGLDRLTPEMRAVVVLRDIQGLSAATAAEVLSISVPTLKSRLHRARLQLRQYLQGYVTQSAA